jgi:opacity protein-like surface antigen
MFTTAAKLFFAISVLSALSLICPWRSGAQGLEVSGGYAHSTADFGLDGFSLGVGYFFTPHVSIAAEYDGLWDTSRVGTFEFTDVGVVVAQSHLQNFLVGPRYYFGSYKAGKMHTINPFGEAQFGVSHLHQSIQEAVNPVATNEDSAFSWMLGGGVDYPLSSHWAARGTLDMFRTHFNANAQSRLRIGIGIAYTFGER